MIDIATDAARQGGQLAYSYIKKFGNVSYKADNSPVTIADKNAERLMRKLISKKYPDHGIIGEELKPTNPKSKYQWIIDPIDGTRDFTRGLPYWCTLLALLENNKPILAVCYFAQSDEMFQAEKGKGAFLNGRKIHVSSVSPLKSAYLSVSSAHHFADHDKLKQLVQLGKSSGAARYFSSYAYSLFWKGKIDGCVLGRGRVWDFAVPALITQEAGGKFSDFKGAQSLESNNAIFSNGKIHEDIKKILNS